MRSPKTIDELLRVDHAPPHHGWGDPLDHHFPTAGLYIIATVSMSVVSVIFSVQGFFKNRKNTKKIRKSAWSSTISISRTRLRTWNSYLGSKREGMFYHFPAIEDLTKMVKRYDSRIYEKTPLHFDFLAYRLGLGKVFQPAMSSNMVRRAQWEERCIGRRRLRSVPSSSKDRQSSYCS